jgi:VWFA-related protein
MCACRSRVLPLAALLCLAGAESAAQPQPIVERVDVARVIFDVRVVDDDGEAIRGLGPDDFEVHIDGEPVRVESALWVGDDAGEEAADREAARAGDGGPAGETLRSRAIAGFAAPEDRGQLIVFVVQKSLVHSRALGLLRLLMHGDRLLARVAPADRVAVVSFDSHLKIWVDFTADLDRVRTVLADEIMFGRPPVLEPAGEPSLLATLSQDEGRRTWAIEEALRELGEALEPLPGAKSVVLIGYGFGDLRVVLGMVGSTLDDRYHDARAALEAARASVFTLDVTQADYHTFEHGLQAVAEDTGGFFVRTYPGSPRRAIDRVTSAITGRYVLFTERPDVEPGEYAVEVDVADVDGTVLARSTYVAR